MIEASTFTRNPRSPGLVIVCLFLLGLTAYELAQFILDDDLNSVIYLGMFIAAAIGIVAVLNDWRKGVYLFLLDLA